MTALLVAGYVADVAILGTYLLLSRTGRARPFHAANAIGCLPIIAIEVITGAWPALVLTASFGLIGVTGLLSSRPETAVR